MRVRGQSAIEYLMTYGWMLLVAATIGAVSFTVFGLGDFEGFSGFGNNNLVLEDFGVTSNDSLQLVLGNVGAEKSRDYKHKLY